MTTMAISDIRPNSILRPDGVSRTMKTALMESISMHGYFEHRPIRVTKNGVGYKILDGHIRFEAAKALYYTHIPVEIV